MKNYDHLIIAVVKKVNRAFAIEKENIGEAISDFRHVQEILITFGKRHKSLFKEFYVFHIFEDKGFEFRKVPTLEEIKEIGECARSYAMEFTRAYFKKGWMEVCAKIVDKDLTHCLKSGLHCFREIYEFFYSCHGIFEKRFDQAIHLVTCNNQEAHTIREQRELVRAMLEAERFNDKMSGKQNGKESSTGPVPLVLDCRGLSKETKDEFLNDLIKFMKK